MGSASRNGGCCWWRSSRSSAARAPCSGWSVTPDGEGFAYAKRHRKTLNQLLGTHIAKSPSDSTFRWLLSQLDVEGFESLLQQWIAAQPGVPEMVDTLVSGGKTLRGSIAENVSGAARFIAQVSLYSNSLGVAIAQNTYATDAGSEVKALRELLDRVELSGLLVQADALHANRPFSSISSSVAPTS